MVRFISFEILATGVLAFECFLRSFKSAAVHSRRAGLCFLGFVFNLDNSVNFGNGAVSTSAQP